MKILVMNGPNINFLGIREKGIYGEQNYEALVSMIEKKAEELGVDWGLLTAGGIITIIPVCIMFFFAQKRLVEGLTAGAVKG